MGYESYIGIFDPDDEANPAIISVKEDLPSRLGFLWFFGGEGVQNMCWYDSWEMCHMPGRTFYTATHGNGKYMNLWRIPESLKAGPHGVRRYFL